jgi:hypothetical protein
MKKIKFNKKIGKKGMTASILVSLIITLVAFTLIAGTLYRFMDKADDKQAEILCHDSIAMRAKTQITIDGALIGGEIKLGPVLCKTIEKKIKSKDREVIKREIAEKIARCWWMFGEGRYEEILHGSDVDPIPSLFDLDERKNQCFNCYYLMIDEDNIKPNDEWRLKDQNNVPIGPAELTDFMWEEKPLKSAPTCEDGEGVDIDDDCHKCETTGDCAEKRECKDNWCVRESSLNYYKYIQYYGGPGQFENLATAIQGRHAYTISFLPKNKEPGASIWLTVAVGAAVVIVGTGVILCTLGTAGICGGVVAAAGTAAGTATAASTTVVAGTATTVAGTSVALSTGGIFIPVTAATGTVAAGSVATASTAAVATATATAATAATTSTATAALAGAGTIVKAGVAVAAGTATATYGAIQGIEEIKLEDMFKERELSSVYLADAQEGQNFCVHGDIGGD